MQVNANGNQRFLDLDERVHDLVSTLERLREEADSYSSASDQLNYASASVTGLSADVSKLVGTTSDVMSALREIGTPRLLAEQRGLAEALERFHTNVDEHQARLEREVAELNTNITAAFAQQASQLADMKVQISSAAAAIEAVVPTVSLKVAEAHAQTASAIEASEARQDDRSIAMVDQLGSTRILVEKTNQALTARVGEVQRLIVSICAPILIIQIVVLILLVLT